MHWMNADEITQPGQYLWRPELYPVACSYGVAVTYTAEGQREISFEGIGSLGPLVGARGRFFGPIPEDEP